MAGPQDWGAVSLDEKESPTSWGAEPAPQEALEPGLSGNTFASFDYAKQYAAKNYQAGNYGRFIAGGAGALLSGFGTMIDYLFSGAQKAYQKGLSPEESTEFAANASLLELGSGKTFMKPAVKAIHPAVQEFKDTVQAPAAQRIDAYAQTGDPNGVRLEPPVPEVKPSDLAPVVGSPLPSVSTSVAAQTDDPIVNMVLNSPVTKAVIDNPVIDRSHDVPYMAGGSEQLNDATVYIDRHVPKEQTIGGITFDPAEPWAVHENVEQHTMELLIKNGMNPEEAYRVAHFGFAEPAEQAWYRAHGIDQVAAEAEQQKWLPHIQHENPENPPPNLYSKPYPHSSVAAARQEAVTETPPTADEVVRGRAIIRTAPELQRESAAPMLQEASDLGVIGPTKPNLNELSPRQAAMAATNKAEVLKGEVTEQSPWRKRFEQTLDKMETPQQARDIISKVLDANDEFEQARQGPLTLAHIDALGDVTGLDPAAIDLKATGATIKSNAQIRNVIEAFRAITDKIKATAVDVAAKAGKDDATEIAELERLEMQRSLLMSEAVTPTKEFVALRAEFGRIGNTIQEFMKIQREAGNTDAFIRERTGQTPNDIRERAKMIAATPAEDLPKALEEMRRNQMGPVYWTWVQGLISGWLTHTKYVLANELYGWIEHGATTPLAAVIGKVKQLSGLASEDVDRVYFGEAAAGIWGHISSVPSAMYATGKVIKAGTRVPLDDEIEMYRAGMKRNEEARARGEPTERIPLPLKRLIESSQLPSNRAVTGEFLSRMSEPALGKNAADNLGYMWSRFLGAPGDIASGIHTFYKIRGRWAAMEELAYHKAVDENLSPVSAEFWQRQRYWAANPTEEMRAQSVEDAYKGTFMQKLDPGLAQLSSAMKKNPVLKWVFPFTHIPLNILGAIQEHSPLAFASKEMRDDILGRNGGAKQDKQIARIMVGSAIMGYMYHKFMMGQSTGEMPNDPKVRAQWMAEGKQPNSLLVGDRWVSVNRFGPMGSLAQYGANLGQAVQVATEDLKTAEYDKAMLDFASELALATAHIATDEVGFQTLQYGFEAWTDNTKWQKFIGQELSSFIPFSSAIGQSAQLTDPYMRKIGGMWDALKYRIPGLRETLPIKQDIFGAVPNPQYMSLLRSAPPTHDPVRLEMSRLGVNPHPPQQFIGHVKLTPEQYAQYQATAAPLTHRLLSDLVNSPGWVQISDGQKAAQMQATITMARGLARSAFQMHNPQLIQQGINARRTMIERPTP